MDILYTLIPLSVVLVLAILAFLGWAVHSGQFEDLDTEAERILLDDDRAAVTGKDAGKDAETGTAAAEGAPARKGAGEAPPAG